MKPPRPQLPCSVPLAVQPSNAHWVSMPTKPPLFAPPLTAIFSALQFLNAPRVTLPASPPEIQFVSPISFTTVPDTAMFSNCTASPLFALQKPTRIPELVSCMPALEAYTVAPATVRFFTAGLGMLVPCCSLLEMRPNSPAALPLSR